MPHTVIIHNCNVYYRSTDILRTQSSFHSLDSTRSLVKRLETFLRRSTKYASIHASIHPSEFNLTSHWNSLVTHAVHNYDFDLENNFYFVGFLTVKLWRGWLRFWIPDHPPWKAPIHAVAFWTSASLKTEAKATGRVGFSHQQENCQHWGCSEGSFFTTGKHLLVKSEKGRKITPQEAFLQRRDKRCGASQLTTARHMTCAKQRPSNQQEVLWRCQLIQVAAEKERMGLAHSECGSHIRSVHFSSFRKSFVHLKMFFHRFLFKFSLWVFQQPANKGIQKTRTCKSVSHSVSFLIPITCRNSSIATESVSIDIMVKI